MPAALKVAGVRLTVAVCDWVLTGASGMNGSSKPTPEIDFCIVVEYVCVEANTWLLSSVSTLPDRSWIE